jgi:hypothetical protein
LRAIRAPELDVKHDEIAKHVVRSSIPRALHEDESGSADSSPQRAVETSAGSALDEIWAWRPKTLGSPMRVKT